MYRSDIEIMDVIFVAKLIGTGSTSEINLGCSFPIDPIATYKSEGMFYIIFTSLIILFFCKIKFY